MARSILGKRSSKSSIQSVADEQSPSKKRKSVDKLKQKWELFDGQDYTFSATEDKMLDKQGNCTVYKGILKRENTDVAVKEIALRASEIDYQEIWEVIALICALRNKFILRLHGASVPLILDNPSLRVNLVAELMEIDLHNALHNPAYQQRQLYLWKGPNGKKVLRGTAKGLKYLHSKNIVHSNIKSQNIFLRGASVKIGDIGSTQLKIRFGTARIGKVSKPEDIRRFGLIVWEIATGKRPHKTHQSVGICEMPNSKEITCDSGLKALYRECISENETARPKASRIVKRLNNI